MVKGKDKILSGAVVLGAGTFIAKILGALYRAPLTNFIGGYGLGLYQMVFPVYVLLLDLSSAGVPTALSKLISSREQSDKKSFATACLKKSISLFTVVGIILSVTMVLLAKIMARGQGNEQAWLGYVFLAPAIVPVCILACFRGYFQGFMKMTPTALSQITEQLIKLVLGLTFAYLALPNIPKAVAGATLAITVAETIACLQTFLAYKIFNKNQKKAKIYEQKFNGLLKSIIKIVLPVTITGILLPLSHVADSFIVINVLSRYRADATELYGLLSGVAHTVIGLPVSICYGISTATLPSVSSSNGEERETRTKKSLILTLVLSLLGAAGCYAFSGLIVKLLFNSLSGQEKIVSIELIKITSLGVVLLSLLQTENAILIAHGKTYIPPITLSLGVIAKILISVLLISNPAFNIYGGAIGLIACYFLPCLVNLIVIVTLRMKNESKIPCNRQLSIG